MKMLAVLFLMCYCIHTGIAACADAPCCSCTNKQCNGDSCTLDENGSGSEPCVNDDFCLLPGSNCCPSDLKFNNVTKCCDAPEIRNTATVSLTSTGLFSLYLLWFML